MIGVVKNCGDVTTIIGKQSQKEITKRDLQIVDQSGMSVNLTLWGADVSTVLGCLLTWVEQTFINRGGNSIFIWNLKISLQFKDLITFSVISCRLNSLMVQVTRSLL